MLGVAVAAAAGIGLAVATVSERNSTALDPISGDRLVLVSTPSGRLAASIPLHATATQVTAGLGSLWVTEADADRVERIDAQARASVDALPYTRSIDARICRLRRKLQEAGGAEAMIKTVRLRGYLFAADV